MMPKRLAIDIVGEQFGPTCMHVCNSLSQQGPLTLDKLVTACNKGVAPGTGASLCGVGTAAVLAARGPGTTAKTSTARFDEPGAARRAVGLLSHSQVAEALIALITHDVVGVSCAPRRSEAEAANAAAKIAAKEAAARHRKAKSRGFDPTSASGGALGAGSISRAATAALKTSALRQLPRTGAVLYTFQVMETLRRLQFARIITLAAQLFGQEGQYLTQALLAQGQARQSPVLDLAMTMAAADDVSLSVGKLASVFHDMKQQNYFEEAKSLPIPIEKQAKPVPPRRKRGGAGGAGGGAGAGAGAGASASSGRSGAGGRRKRKVASLLDSDEDDDDDDDPMDGSRTVGKQRGAAYSNKLMRVSTQRFIEYFGHSFVRDYLSQKFDETDGAIVCTMLDMARSRAVATKRNTSVTGNLPVSARQTFKALSSKKGAPKWKTFLDRLHALKGDGTGFIDQLSNNKEGGLFVVQLAAVHTALKQHIVMDHIEARHGENCARIVRLLLAQNMLEEKQVGDMSLVTLKEARAMLYKLMAAKITQLQEVPRKPDHNPMVTFYLWSVNMSQLFAVQIDEVSKAIFNCRQRRRYEMTRNAPSAADTKEEAEMAKAKQSAALDKLDAVMLRLSETLLLLAEWYRSEDVPFMPWLPPKAPATCV